jgi:methyl-accepting chemotaxis protein
VKFSHYTVNLKNFRESFWFRLFSSLIVVIIIVLSVFSFMHIYREGSKVNENLAKKGKMVAGFLASSSRTGIFAENTEALENIAEGVMNEEDIASVSFYSADWNVLYQTSKKGGMSNRPDFHRNISGQLREPHSFKLVETPDSIEYFTPVTLEVFPTMAESLYFEDTDITQTEKIIGYVHVGMDKKNLPAEIKAIIYRDLTLLFVISLAGIITIYIATRKVTVPLLKLTENVRMLGIEGSAEKIDFESNDEIGRLAAAFNKMAEDLRRREEEKESPSVRRAPSSSRLRAFA